METNITPWWLWLNIIVSIIFIVLIIYTIIDNKKNKRLRIWLDDVRPMPKGFNYWAKSVKDVSPLLFTDKIDFISFDHDLGDQEETGYVLAKTIEKSAFNNIIKPFKWEIHSANPVGRKNIEMAMNNADKFWSEHES